VEQYLWSDSLIAVSSLPVVCSKNRGMVEHLLQRIIYLCKDFYSILESNKDMVIQIDAKVILRPLKSPRKDTEGVYVASQGVYR
jgi:hypothetical protein